jgi:hypothetical protein
MAVNINIPSEVTQTITDGVTATAPSENAVFDALALKANSADLALVATTGDYNDLSNLPTLPSGTVTSVGLTMPSAFSVANSPITSSGDIAVTGAGVASQYVRGDGSLANFPTTSGGGASVSYYLNGSVSQGTFGGIAMREINKVPIIGAGTDFTINANGYIQSFITDANDPNQLEIPAGNWNFETYFSASSNGGNPSFYVELYKWDGATLTLIASNSTNPEIITGGTAIDLYLTALAVPQTTLALTDRLVVRIYVTHSGRTIKLHTEDNHLSQIITTFSTGLTSLNGITAQVQNLAVGTSGTDFAISSATNTHTFNLPTASATNRGALSTSDWSAFNGKQAALVSGTNIKTINGTSVLGSGDITVGGGIAVGTTAVTSGTIGRVFFQGTGDVVQQSASLFWDNTNARLGVGATPSTSVRLDVRAQGALSTDIAFRVRNSADSLDIIKANGRGDVFIGQSAGRFTTGISNVFMGINTGSANITGQENTAIGANAALSNLGSQNTYLGALAGQNGTTAGYSVFIGYGAGFNSNAVNGIFIGQTASITGGNGTIALGYNAGGGTGQQNLSLGQSSGLGMTTGSFNTHLGYRSVASGVTTGNYNCLVGSDIVVGAVSNTAVLADNQGNIAIRKDAANFVGVGYAGTNTLGAKLDIKAQGALVSNLALRVRNSADTSNLFVVKGNGVLNAANIPTSAAGLVTGDIWSNLGILTIV